MVMDKAQLKKQLHRKKLRILPNTGKVCKEREREKTNIALVFVFQKFLECYRYKVMRENLPKKKNK